MTNSYKSFFDRAKKSSAQAPVDDLLDRKNNGDRIVRSMPSHIGKSSLRRLSPPDSQMSQATLAAQLHESGSSKATNSDWAARQRRKKNIEKKTKSRNYAMHLRFLGVLSLLGTLWASTVLFEDEITWLAKKVEVRITQAGAADPGGGEAQSGANSSSPDKSAKPEEKNSVGSKSPDGKTDPATAGVAKGDPAKASDNVNSNASANTMTVRPAAHLLRLEERARELDLREKELDKAEAELLKEKLAIADRLKELANERQNISKLVEEKVRLDEQKLEALVQVYTSMKALTAAKVFDTMDEDLAIEIISRMKKKSAADILNLVKPEKAQVLSEKYAGYKRK